ncbi:double-strand break repair protein MRE11-like [Sitodiplosis mosellana]|uniref:double-strand break repair protein MRE11-like n=1 Tax=Sitodiplosis mosellana TaxID=263140 RepID=UPI002443E40C|nr:double-strand break repair protein MRE11-like [Sitodiplosis mosellana]
MTSTEEQTNGPDPEDCFKILLATDIHLGYKEKDEIIGKDSFVTFAEILQHAKQREVDFILLGGDLFHDTNPSKEALQKCMELLRAYTLGDTPISFEILSDHEVNYHDANLNVAIPVFSIHGNHDDPSGYGGLSSMDLLETSGLLNYFGKCNSLEEVNIKPILMKKGTTQLALYGLSHIHDNRLARLFRDTKVTMDQPDERSGEWFNVMVLHQNRVDRGPKNYVPQEILPEIMDFILWGHEHDCRVIPEEVPGKSFFVSQPGSSVATSLSEGESIEKHIAILHVCQNQFKCEPIKLQTVRPFIFKSINLQDYEDELDLDEGDVKPKVKELISGIINQMIDEAKTKLTDCRSQPKEPLIRLRVLYQNEDYAINEVRFGQQFNQQVANPSEVLKMQRNTKRVKVEKRSIDEEAMNNAFNKDDEEEEEDIRLEDYVDRYFKDPNNSERLQVLFPTCLSEVCRRLAEYNDDDAANKTIGMSINKACDFLNDKMPEDTDIEDALDEYRLTGEQVFKDIQKALSSRKSTTTALGQFLMNVDGDDDDQSNEKENKSTSNARGSRASKATTSKSTASKSTASKTTASGRGRGSTRGRAPASLNVSTSRGQQPTIQQSLGRRSTRPTRGIVYDLDDSD